MLDDKLKCPQCQAKFYYNEVTNVVHHRKKKCRSVVHNVTTRSKRNCPMAILSLTKKKSLRIKNVDLGQEPLPEQYKKYQNRCYHQFRRLSTIDQENDRLPNGPMSSGIDGRSKHALENEELNR